MSVWIIAGITFREAARKKILWTALFAGLAFLLVFGIGLRFQVGDFRNSAVPPFLRYQVISAMLMIGLYTVDLLAVVMTTLTSVDTISGEITSGTIHAIATKPLARWQILVGKWLGFVAMAAAYVAIMFWGTIAEGYWIGGVMAQHPVRGALLVFLECIIALSVTFMFGTWFSTLSSGVITLGLLGVAFLLVLVDRLELLVVVLVLVLIRSGTLNGAELVVVLVEVVVIIGLVLVLVLLLGVGIADSHGGAVGLGSVGCHLVGAEDVGRGEQLRRGGGGNATIAARNGALRLGEQRHERARQSVYLVGRELGAVGELRLIVGEQPLESQQQRELAPPGGRRVLGLGVGRELGERPIERAPARAAGRQRDGGILAGVHEALAHELFRSRDLGGTRNGHGRWDR